LNRHLREREYALVPTCSRIIRNSLRLAKPECDFAKTSTTPVGTATTDDARLHLRPGHPGAVETLRALRRREAEPARGGDDGTARLWSSTPATRERSIPSVLSAEQRKT
jgi:hypothetical protein